jgi:hypothetical protein
MTKYECEYCMEYPLKSYVIDELGGVYCNEYDHKQMSDNVYEAKWKIVEEVVAQ